ncbi:MAG: hypothetical protein EOL91_09015 [Actinobacteria bacterium]|nr:hypothetical protein [Actinomycetota bacterium]
MTVGTSWEGLRITKRPSGGRGEYEFVGSDGPFRATDMYNHAVILDTPFGEKETQVFASVQGGKNRARLLNPVDRSNPHIAPLLAALLMMPAPTREESAISRALPVVLDHGYIMDVGVELASINSDTVLLRPRKLIARSRGISDVDGWVELDIQARSKQLKLLHATSEHLPAALRAAVTVHEKSQDLHGLELFRPTRESTDDIMRILLTLDEFYLPKSDPLPTLLAMVGLTNSQDLEIPIPTQTPNDVEIRVRAERTYRYRLAAQSRGASARSFAREVMSAYNYTCLFCALTTPPSRLRMGLEAAHILPWARFDLDLVSNGIALCRQHHWAFDERVLALDVAPDGSYEIRKGAFYKEVPITTPMNELIFTAPLGPVPEERLPPADKRPSPNLLAEFNALIK